MIQSQNPLVQQVLSGANRQLTVMAAQGLVPIPPNELIPLQVMLAQGGDPEVSQAATQALQDLDPRLAAQYLGSEAPPSVLTYFALEIEAAPALEAILRRRDIPRQLLVAIAPNLTAELQEVLLLRQDAIREKPAILDALERNPQLSSFARRRIGEYREHLVRTPEASPAVPQPAAERDAEVDEAASVAEAAVAESSKGEEPDISDPANLTDVQIRSLPLPLRMKLSREANTRTLRSILIRDTNSTVALSTLENNNFSEPEIEGVASNRNMKEDVLQAILRNRQWMSKYAIMAAVTRNPKAPINQTLRLVPRLSMRDLRDLRKDRNAADAVRKMADRLYKAKMR